MSIASLVNWHEPYQLLEEADERRQPGAVVVTLPTADKVNKYKIGKNKIAVKIISMKIGYIQIFLLWHKPGKTKTHLHTNKEWVNRKDRW